jgi:serine/threonine protein kinase
MWKHIVSNNTLGIVHGDIKPHNILIFGNNSPHFTAKLTDFGYSRFLAPQESKSFIYLPASRPWTAPEHHHRGFNFVAAKKQDVYCFGMYSLWLIFYHQSNTENWLQRDISGLQGRPVIDLVTSRVEDLDVAHDKKIILRRILELCLAAQPEHRSDMSDVLTLLQSIS